MYWHLPAQARAPYPPGYGFPAPFGRRPSLLGPSCARCGIEPPFRRSSGLLDLRPDHNGVAAFHTSEIRSGWVLPVLRGLGVLARNGSGSHATTGALKLLFFGDCSTISAGRAEAQGLFPRVFPRFRGRTVLTALIVTWRPRIRCERRRIHGEEAQADPMGCTDDATVSFFDPLSPSKPSVPATFFDEASSEVNSRSPVRPSPRPAGLDGSGSPWASPLCSRMLRYLALAGVRDWPGHWLEHDHESCSLKLVQHRVATSPKNRTGTVSTHPAQA